MSSNKAWFDRALDVIPGGVDSPVRSFRSVGGTPYTVASGEGAYVTDVEGNALPRLRPVLRRVAARPRPSPWSWRRSLTRRPGHDLRRADARARCCSPRR